MPSDLSPASRTRVLQALAATRAHHQRVLQSQAQAQCHTTELRATIRRWLELDVSERELDTMLTLCEDDQVFARSCGPALGVSLSVSLVAFD